MSVEATSEAVVIEKQDLAHFHARLGRDGLLPGRLSGPDYAARTLLPVEKLRCSSSATASFRPQLNPVSAVSAVSPSWTTCLRERIRWSCVVPTVSSHLEYRYWRAAPRGVVNS